MGTIGAQRLPAAFVALLRDCLHGCKATLAELSCHFIERAAIAVGCAVGERCGNLTFGRTHFMFDAYAVGEKTFYQTLAAAGDREAARSFRNSLTVPIALWLVG